MGAVGMEYQVAFRLFFGDCESLQYGIPVKMAADTRNTATILWLERNNKVCVMTTVSTTSRYHRCFRCDNEW